MSGCLCNIYLPDSNNQDLAIGTISNWNGMVIKLPREILASNKVNNDRVLSNVGISTLRKFGVYFLVNDTKDTNRSVYIGESENVAKRLSQHMLNISKNVEHDLTYAYCILGNDLDKTKVKWLEYFYVMKARNALSWNVRTKASSSIMLSHPQLDIMYAFEHNSTMLLQMMGCSLFSTLPKQLHSSNDVLVESDYECIFNGRVAYMTKKKDGQCVVKTGSEISEEVSPSMKEYVSSYADKREKLIQDGIIKNNKFTCDYPFRSPSEAAAVVLGRSSRMSDWKAVNH